MAFWASWHPMPFCRLKIAALKMNDEKVGRIAQVPRAAFSFWERLSKKSECAASFPDCIFDEDLDAILSELKEIHSDLRLIPTDLIAVAGWVRLKCRYGCKAYGKLRRRTAFLRSTAMRCWSGSRSLSPPNRRPSRLATTSGTIGTSCKGPSTNWRERPSSAAATRPLA